MFKNLKLVGGFLIVIFLALLVYAVGDLSVTHITTTSFTVNPGDTISGNFSMSNTNATDNLTVDFPNTVDLIGTNYNYTGIGVGYNVSDSFNLVSSSTEYVSYDITMPSDIYADANSYSANVNITAGTGNWDNFSLDITVNPVSNLSASDITTSAVRGYSKTEAITLSNIGNTDLTGVTYSATDLTSGNNVIGSGNITFNPVSSVDVDYNESAQVNVTVDVPSTQATGTYTGNVTFTYDSKTVVSSLTVTVQQEVESLSATSASATWIKEITESKTAVFTINNTGNVALSVTNIVVGTISYNNENITGTITLNATTATIAPSESEDIALEIKDILSNRTSGTYTGDITIDWGTGNQTNSTLTVTVTSPSYSIMTIPDPITFGDVDQDTNVSISFNITNNGNAQLNNVNLVSNLASKYNIQLSSTSLGTLSVNGSRLIAVDVTIPNDETTGYHSLGSISLTSNEYNTSLSLYADVRGKLDISDIDVWVDGDSDKNLEDGDEIGEKAKPSSIVKFDIRLDNRFTDDEDIEIEDIEVTITIEEIDDGDELEETLDEFDLKADKHKRVEHEFEIPLKVDEGTYYVVIFAEGEDENGVRHTDEVTLKLELDKESHEIVIDKVELFPDEISCGDYTTLEVSVTNIGTHTEDETVLSITSSDFDINIKEEIELDDDPDDDENSFKKTYTIEIPSDISAGNYPIDIRVYYDMDEISDYTREYLTIKECAVEAEDEEESETGEVDETVILETGGEELMPPTIMEPEVQPWIKEPSTTLITFTKSNAYLALLVLANIALVGVVGILVVKFLFVKKI